MKLKKYLSLLLSVLLIAAFSACQSQHSPSDLSSEPSSEPSSSEPESSTEESSSEAQKTDSNPESSSQTESQLVPTRIYTEKDVQDVEHLLSPITRNMSVIEELARGGHYNPDTDESEWITVEENGSTYTYLPFEPHSTLVAEINSLGKIRALLSDTFTPECIQEYYEDLFFKELYREFDGKLYCERSAGRTDPFGWSFISNVIKMTEDEIAVRRIRTEWIRAKVRYVPVTLTLENRDGKWLFNSSYHAPIPSAPSPNFSPEEQEIADILELLQEQAFDLVNLPYCDCKKVIGYDPVTGIKRYDESTWIRDEEHHATYIPFDSSGMLGTYETFADISDLIDNTLAPGQYRDYYRMHLLERTFKEIDGKLYYTHDITEDCFPKPEWNFSDIEIKERTEEKISLVTIYYLSPTKLRQGTLVLEKKNGKWLLNDTFFA